MSLLPCEWYAKIIASGYWVLISGFQIYLVCCLPQANGCLSYFDKVPDGFYFIRGLDPYVWSLCSNVRDSGRMPSIESLKAIDPRNESSVEVILVDQRTDASLKELQNRVRSISSNCDIMKEVVDQLVKLICNLMRWV